LNYFEHLNSLKPYCLVTTARGGSDFLQSLLDGHPQICLFNLNFRFFSEYLKTAQTWNQSQTIFNDFIDEFIGLNIERLQTIYQVWERQDTLGKNKNQSLNINSNDFKANFLKIVDGQKVSEKTLFLGIYGSYHMSLKRDIFKTKILFHHAHTLNEASAFSNHFNQAKLIITTRDPRSAFVSSVENARLTDRQWDNLRHVYISLCQMVIEDPAQNAFFNKNNLNDIPKGPQKTKNFIEKIDPNPLVIRLEDIPKKSILIALSNYFNIKYSNSMEISTWGGLEWWGDRVSKKDIKPKGWSKNRSYNGWKSKLALRDQFIILNCLNGLLKKYNYEKKSHKINKVFAFIILFLPLRYELRLMNPLLLIKRLIKGGISQKIHQLSVPFFVIKIRLLLLSFLLADIKGTWSNWPGEVLKENSKST
jgi:hypothetical protein